MKKLKTILTIILVFFSIYLGYDLFGMGNQDATYTPHVMKAWNYISEDILKIPVPAPGRDRILNAYRDLYRKAVAFVKNGDREGLASLTVSATKDDINNMFDTLKDLIGKGFNDQQFYCVCKKAPYYICGVCFSRTTGKENKKNTETHAIQHFLSFMDDEWRFDFSEKAMNELDEAYRSELPVELQKAYSAGRNVFRFESEDSWIDSNFFSTGTILAKVYYAWQNEDGSVSALIGIKNGFYDTQTIQDISLTLTDSVLGTVAHTTLQNESVAGWICRTMIVTVPGSEVKTGQKAWHQMNADCRMK